MKVVNRYIPIAVLSSLFQLAKKDMYADKSRVVVGVVALVVAVAFSLILAALVGSLFRLTEEKVGGGGNPNEIRVLPKFSVGFFRVTKEEQRKIDENVLKELKNIPGVEGVRGEMVLEFPASLDVSILGTRFETDSPIYGIDDNVFAELSGNKTTDANIAPILISRELVDIYNLGIAQAINKPLINEDVLGGFELDIILGYSSFFRDASADEKRTIKGKVVAITENIPIIGITLPRSLVEKLNREKFGEDYMPKYTRAYLTKSTTSSYAEIQGRVNALGFDTFSVEEQVQGVQNRLSFVVLFFYILVGVILCLVVLLFYYLFYTHFRDRRYMFGLMRSLGASTGQIVYVFLAQVCMIVVWGIAIGSLVALGLLAAGNLFFSPMLENLISFKGNILSLSPWEYGEVVILTIVLVFLAVSVPVYMAITLRPRETLLEK